MKWRGGVNKDIIPPLHIIKKVLFNKDLFFLSMCVLAGT